jgi:hypothetical protein
VVPISLLLKGEEMKKKNIGILLFLIIISEFVYSDENERINLNDHVGLLCGFTASIPIGVIGLLKISEEKIAAPDDSVLYRKESNEPYLVRDHNSDVALKMVTFFGFDILVCATIGQIIDKIRIKKKNENRLKITNCILTINPYKDNYAGYITFKLH